MRKLLSLGRGLLPPVFGCRQRVRVQVWRSAMAPQWCLVADRLCRQRGSLRSRVYDAAAEQ